MRARSRRRRRHELYVGLGAKDSESAPEPTSAVGPIPDVPTTPMNVSSWGDAQTWRGPAATSEFDPHATLSARSARLRMTQTFRFRNLDHALTL